MPRVSHPRATDGPPLRLLFVATLPEPGGACTCTTTLVAALTTLGHEVTVLATPGPGVWEELGTRPGLTRVAGTFRRAFDDAAIAPLDAALRAQPYDHVFAVFEQDYWGTLRTARRHRVPVTCFLHHAGMRRTNRLLLPFARPTYLVPSADLKDWIVARRTPQRRVHVLANPLDTQHFVPDAALRTRTRTALGIAPDDVLIGFVGRLEHNKGVVPSAEAVNAAMSEHPQLRALWIGSGRREAEVDAVIARAIDPARHVRRPWTTDVHSAYCAMDLLALPSTGRESFGRVLAEAQCCEVPVLGSAIGGIPMAMHPGVSGELVAPGDVEAWASAIGALAANPERRAAMGRAGRSFVRTHFEHTVIAAALARFVRERAR